MDDFSLQPLAPSMDFTELPNEPMVDEVDKRLADAHYHPAWAQVFVIFQEELDSLVQDTDGSLPSDEYKVEDLSKRKARNTLLRVMQRIEDAVAAVETVERKPTKGVI